MDLSHHVFTMVYKGNLCRAPIDKPARVLDVGTGTGIWVMDFGEYVLSFTISSPIPRS
jgi:ubiquinone/menaquinone biosynthesis C-methylase UbiE